MTNPGTPTAPSGGGMPKWLIIVLVAVLVIGIGCCGGVYMCFHVVNKAAQTGVEAMQRQAEQMQADALKQAADARQRAAAEAAAAGGNGAATPIQGGTTAPAAGAGAGGGGDADGGVAAALAAAAAGNNNQGITSGLGTGRMPANFPADVPVMNGLSPTGISTADKMKGSGMIAMTGAVTHDDAVAYYDKELQNQGWKEETNQDIMGQTIMTFSKDTRTLTVQVIADGNTGKSMVNFEYETKP